MGFAQVIRTVLVSYMHLPLQNFDIAGLIYYAVNIPVLILAMKNLGKQFLAKTVICVTATTGVPLRDPNPAAAVAAG